MSTVSATPISAPMRPAVKALATAGQPRDGLLALIPGDSFRRQSAPVSTMKQLEVWSAAVSLVAGLIFGIMGRPIGAIVLVGSAILDGALAIFS